MKSSCLYTLVLQVRANYFTTNMICGPTDELQHVCVSKRNSTVMNIWEDTFTLVSRATCSQ